MRSIIRSWVGWPIALMEPLRSPSEDHVFSRCATPTEDHAQVDHNDFAFHSCRFTGEGAANSSTSSSLTHTHLNARFTSRFAQSCCTFGYRTER